MAQTEFPERVGQVKLDYFGPRADFFYPFCSQRHRIKLSKNGKPEIYLLRKKPWLLYSHIRKHIPGHSRAYYCVGEENDHAFVARISQALWSTFVEMGEKDFLFGLEPSAIADLEKNIIGESIRVANFWRLELPEDMNHIKDWLGIVRGWKVTLRTVHDFPLLGENSAWTIKRGTYARIWKLGIGALPAAVVSGRIVCKEFGYKIDLDEPNLVALTHGWQYRSPPPF